MDFKQVIIDGFKILEAKEKQDGNAFKARAYKTAIESLKAYEGPITSMEDLIAAKLKGFGKSLMEKAAEVVSTGKMARADEVAKDPKTEAMKQLQGVYGIGPKKAISLVEMNIMNIAALKNAVAANPKLLNDKQHIGLKYAEDISERIPRTEMDLHFANIKNEAKSFKNLLHIEVVGSYRRGAQDSGDIDVIACVRDGHNTLSATDIANTFVTKGYIIQELAAGDKKYMGICRLPNSKARRIDIMVTNEDEFPYALLYFTGPDKFNIRMRREALKQGYTMNEHSMNHKETGEPAPFVARTEKDVFKFLGMDYKAPIDRE